MTKLLLVEDDETVREALALNLRAERHQVETAEDGDQGLSQARLMNPDLIVLAVMLPVLGGLTVCRVIRNESDVPIFLPITRGTETDKNVGLETGADDYMVKPFSPRQLSARKRDAFVVPSSGIGFAGPSRPHQASAGPH